MTTYWHMQMHPNNPTFAFTDDALWSILENNKIIGIGSYWKDGDTTIDTFKNKIKVNDIIAIKTGSSLIALVQVIGGEYEVEEDESDIGWMVHRRPIRILDWAMDGETIEQPRGTLNICKDQNKATSKTIKSWHDKVCTIMKKRKIPLTV